MVRELGDPRSGAVETARHGPPPVQALDEPRVPDQQPGVVEATAGSLGDGVGCGDLDPLGHQHVDYRLSVERSEQHAHAPACDRDERARDRLPGDDDHGAVRWLLDRLQQHRSGLVDDVEVDEDEDLVPGGPRGAQSRPDHLARLIDRDGGADPLGHDEIGMAPGQRLSARGALPATAIGAHEGGSEGDRRLPAAGARRADEEIGVDRGGQ